MVVKSLDVSRNTSFRMEDRGPVISIKYSPDMKVLAIQRVKTSVVSAHVSSDCRGLRWQFGTQSLPVLGVCLGVLVAVWTPNIISGIIT